MVIATVNSYQYSSTEASEKQMLTAVFDLKNKELSREKYNPSGCLFVRKKKDSNPSASLRMCKYIHATFKIILICSVYVGTQQSHWNERFDAGFPMRQFYVCKITPYGTSSWF